jgi:methionyl-tRNA synthetase
MGGAYSTIAADVVARFQRMQGKDVNFVTGTDEHGEKIAESAAKAGVAPQEHCDRIAEQYKALWQLVRHVQVAETAENMSSSSSATDFIKLQSCKACKCVANLMQTWHIIKRDCCLQLDIRYTSFVRTTSAKHEAVVKMLLEQVWSTSDIFPDSYSGRYCVACEEYKDDEDVDDAGFCLVHNVACPVRKEVCYSLPHLAPVCSCTHSGHCIPSTIISQDLPTTTLRSLQAEQGAQGFWVQSSSGD